MKKFLIALVIFMTMLIVGGIYYFQQTTGSYYQARVEAVDIAERQANLENWNEFYWFNGMEETYFTVTGTSTDDVPIIVIVRQSDGAIQVYDQRETVSEQDALAQMRQDVEPAEILETRIGMDSNLSPVWEISYKNENGGLGYYLLSLETGEWIRTIDNI